MCDFDLSPVDTLDKTSAEAVSDEQESTIVDDSSTDDGVSHVNDIIEGTDDVTKQAKDLDTEAHPNNQLIVTIFDTCVANNAVADNANFVEDTDDVKTKHAKDLEAHPDNQLIVFDTCVANNTNANIIANASEKEPFLCSKEPDGENEATTASKNKYISFKGMTFKVGKIFRCCFFK